MNANAPSDRRATGAPSRVWEVLARTDYPAFATDERDVIVFWNAAAERWFGRSAAAALGKPRSRVVPTHDLFTPSGSTRRDGSLVKSVSLAMFELPGRGRESKTFVRVLQPSSRPDVLAGGPQHLADVDSGLRPEDAPGLTQRECEILRCVAAGFQNKEIARELRISHATVRNHIQNLLRKLDVHSKLEAVSLAFRRGWVRGDSASVVPTERARAFAPFFPGSVNALTASQAGG